MTYHTTTYVLAEDVTQRLRKAYRAAWDELILE